MDAAVYPSPEAFAAGRVSACSMGLVKEFGRLGT